MIEPELFEQCKRKDGRAQQSLYMLYKARLMGLCRRYAADREEAQDMLQEAFIKIFTNIHQVSAAEKLEGWMKSVAVRTAIDHYHKRKRSIVFPEADNSLEVANADYESMLDNLTDEYLVSLVNALPEGCRLVFNLFVVEGYSHTEIATLLGVTEGTSRSQLHHAKFLLKQRLTTLGVKRYEKLA
jgi:RNA polymerase sigma factor (sigma-70 family)